MTMQHPSEDDLVLLYYGEAPDEDEDVRTHVERCPRCRAELEALEETLSKIGDGAVPDPGADYEARVWGRLEPELELERRGRAGRSFTPYWLAAAAAAVIAASFLVGRWTAAPPGGDRAAQQEQIRERILLVALGEHLRESQVLLLEVKNGPDGAGASTLTWDRARADELVRESRLYRQTAYRVGDAATVEVLDELERLLLDVAHGPSSEEGLEALRRRIAEQDVLFKLRVLETSVSEKTVRRF